MAVKECDPCLLLKKTSLAEKICFECAENLCMRCVDEHARRKATARHKPTMITRSAYRDERLVGRPSVSNVSIDEVTLTWDPPFTKIGEDDYYQVSFKEIGRDRRWRYFPEEFRKSRAVLNELKSNISYVFRVRAVYVEGEGPFSLESDIVTTSQSQASRVSNGVAAVGKEKSPSVILVPMVKLTDTKNDAEKIQEFHIGKPKTTTYTNTKTILLVGATGSGKSTLVDGFINYFMGVNWRDPFRFTARETAMENNEINKALSQEDWITYYTLNPEDGSRLNYQLRIVDTPGFGDTRGIERDQIMIEKIQILFSRLGTNCLTHIDAICFVLKAPDSRLTLHQKYIFQLIMSIFGNDVEKNICSLITFADGKDPPVLAGMKESKLSFGCTFNFNNCALFMNNKVINPSSVSPIFWKISMTGFRCFFQHLDRSTACNLDKTRVVLKVRLKIDLYAKQLQPIIDDGLMKIKRLQQEDQERAQLKKVVESYKDFEICETEEQQRRREVPRGQHVTNCLNCNISCHINCTCSPGDKSKCQVMDYRGYCTKCPNKCHWQQHADTPYIFEIASVIVRKVLHEKRQKYLEQNQILTTKGISVEKLKTEAKDLFHNANYIMTELQTCTDKLDEIALQVNPSMVITDHIDVLLHNEKLERKEGFMKRISLMKEIQKRAKLQKCFKLFKDEVNKLL